MPRISGQGQNRFTTERKERDFGYAISHNLQVHKNLCLKWGASWPYFYFDAYAGCGVNHKVIIEGEPLVGSPQVFLNEADSAGVNHHFAYLCDKDPAAIIERRKFSTT